MPVIFPQASPAAVAAVKDFVSALPAKSQLLTHLPKLRQGMAAAHSAKGGADPVAVPVYSLGVKDVLARQDLSALKAACWTHVLSPRTTSQQPVATAQTDLATSQVQALSEHPPTFWAALDHLQALPDVARSDYDLAELRVPALHVEALVLRSKGSGTDVVVPFLSHADGVKVGHLYSFPDFLTALQPLARSVDGMSTGAPTGG